MASTTILSDNGVSSGSAGIKTTGGNDGALVLQTTTAGGAATTTLTLGSDQSVTAAGNLKTSSGYMLGTTGTSGFLLLGTASDTTSGATIVVRNNSSTYDAGGAEFYTGGAERARIDSSGNLLVGTNTFLGNGGFSLAPNYSAGAPQAVFNRNSTTSTSYPLVFLNNGSPVGSVSYTNTATSFNTSSDYRLKDNVQPMTNALSVVQALKPVTYNWKVDGSEGQGFIAHELQSVVPDCVTGEKDAVDEDGNPVYQGIDTSFLVATLTAAIQEQQAIIQTLEARLAALEAK